MDCLPDLPLLPIITNLVSALRERETLGRRHAGLPLGTADTGSGALVRTVVLALGRKKSEYHEARLDP